MKICYLANAASIHTKRWAEHFKSIGHKVFVVSFEPGRIQGVQVFHIPAAISQRHVNVLMRLPKVRQIVREIDPDIIHAHYVTSYGMAGVVTGLHPLVISAWGSDVLVMPENSIVYRLMVRFCMQKADLVTSIADHMTNLILKRRYADSQRIVTFPFGVDTDIFTPKREVPKRNSPCVVVSTRRLDVGLDVDVLIKSIPAVLERHPSTKFIIAGDGPLHNDLVRLSKKLHLCTDINFVGSVQHSEMPGFLRKADIFISTSKSDGNNISLNEGMACGCFPIATDIDANRNWLDNGVNGLLFPCGDHEALAKRIIQSIENLEWRQSIIDHNYDIIRKRASWKNEMEKMENIYQQLL